MSPTELMFQSLRGLWLGDCFGQTFFGRQDTEPDPFNNRLLATAPWRFTDDTILAVCVVQELLHNAPLDQTSLAQRMAERYTSDPWRGFGGTMHGILQAIHEGRNWSEVAPAAFDGMGSMGNGAAMRVAPLGAFYVGDLSRAEEEGRRQAAVTHAHTDAQEGAVAIAVATAWFADQSQCGLLNDVSDGQRRELFEVVLGHMYAGEMKNAVAKAANLDHEASVRLAVRALGNGSKIMAIDTVPFCLWCVARWMEDYEEALWTAASARGDIDTNCAIVGGILAAHSAFRLPQTWIDASEPMPL